jgi:hypothetical protein
MNRDSLSRREVGAGLDSLAPSLRHPCGRWREVNQLCLFLATCLAAGGCLWSPPIELEEQQPNQPPVIEVMSLIPELSGPVAVAPDCARFKFLVGTVRDPDLEDVLYVRWYEDYETGEPRLLRERSIASNGRLERTGPQLTITVELASRSPEWRALPHALLIAVADRAFGDGEEIAFPEGQEGLLDLWQWTFFLADGGICLPPD